MTESAPLQLRSPRVLTSSATQLLYATTIFLSAFLLFWVQPMFAKMTLPLLGGAPSVWTTAMLFFQTVLLAGYAYTHFISRSLLLRRQVLTHLCVIAFGLIALPVAVAKGVSPSIDGAPVLWLISYYTMSIGAPFFALSATAPLLQRWFSLSGHQSAADPYFLYSSSNIGSMIALLGYPILLEPALRLQDQSAFWTIGYVLLGLLILLCGLVVWRSGSELTERSKSRITSATSVTWSKRRRWTLLAFAPSSLLLGLTTFITSDVASAPLLWVIPLALYLLSFILVFARRQLIPHRVYVRLQPALVVIIAVMSAEYIGNSWLGLGFNLIAFFVVAMVCHGELARERPEAEHLTQFYLCMSFGGMLGGVFNALIAPVLFNGVYEYALAVIAVCAVAPWAGAANKKLQSRDILLPVLVVAVFLVAPQLIALLPEAIRLPTVVGILVVGSLVVYSFHERPPRFALGIASLFIGCASLYSFMTNNEVLLKERSFFGAYRVTLDEGGSVRLLRHGTTIHGAQYVDPKRWNEPINYYYSGGPLGQFFDAMSSSSRIKSVGVVGLGVGATSCYRKSDQTWTYYEIDPLVEEIARDDRYFRYMTECAQDTTVVIGDARLSLELEQDDKFDLLILDAFSSDSIPIHLITQEAFELYAKKINTDGIIILHVSSRFLDLVPQVSAISGALKLESLFQHHTLEQDPDTLRDLIVRTPSKWIVLAKNRSALQPLLDDQRWQTLSAAAPGPLWTDDHSNLFYAITW